MFSSIIQFQYQFNIWILENESCLKTLEIRSNYLEDEIDLENEFTFKTLEIRSKVQIFLPTPMPTTPPNIGPYFNSDIKSIS